MRRIRALGTVLLLALSATGCAAQIVDDSSADSEAAEMRTNPLAMPADICSFEKTQGWGQHHLEWHTSRQWDLLAPQDRTWAQKQGWHRALLQEGQIGNGLEFLAMHRAMLDILRTKFPTHVDLFVGWTSPPTSPTDKIDPLPNGGTTAFDKTKLAAIDRLTHHLDSFASDDELGLFIQTSLRPTKTDPAARSTDAAAGIHNYLHNRFMNPSSAIDIGDPSVNLQNKEFWRLHGWIDSRWTEFRKIKNLRDDERTYKDALDNAAADLQMKMKMPEDPGTSTPAPLTLRKFFERG
jgi:hypothetical protein